MKKPKRIVKIEPTESAEISKAMAQKPRYRNVPLDIPTHDQMMELCRLRGFGQRGQGAYVGVLIKKDFAAAKKAGLLKE